MTVHVGTTNEHSEMVLELAHVRAALDMIDSSAPRLGVALRAFFDGTDRGELKALLSSALGPYTSPELLDGLKGLAAREAQGERLSDAARGSAADLLRRFPNMDAASRVGLEEIAANGWKSGDGEALERAREAQAEDELEALGALAAGARL